MSEKVFDRSKFKGAKLSSLKETKQEADSKDKRLLGGDYKGRANFHRVEEGRNEFRILPPHDPKDPAYRPVRTSMLKCDVPVYEEGKDTGKTEKKNKKVFIATQHGNEQLRKLGKDPIELYIKYVGEEAGLISDKDERNSFLAPIKGFRKDGKWNWGIMPKTSFTCYALKDGELGRLELWDKWVQEMDKITALIEEEEDEVLEIDPFSDPDEGYPIVIKKEKNEKGRWDYTIDRVNPKKRQSWDEFCEENRITDSQLKELFDKDSLTELYVDVYTKRDYDLAINGLMNLDKDWKLGIFENEEFLAELKEIEAVVPEDESPEGENNKLEETFKKAGEDTSKWPKPKCKKHLRAFIMDAYEGTEEEQQYLDVVENLGLPELREWCAMSIENEELPELKEESAEESSKDVEAPEDTQSEESYADIDEELDNVVGRRRRRSK
jgi:hypothetical protein